MTSFFKTIFLAGSSAAILALLTGCPAHRPTPDQTMPMDEGDFQAGYTGEHLRGATDDTETLSPGERDDELLWGDDLLGGLQPRPDYNDDDQIRDLFEPVFFDFDRSAINAPERPKIEEVAEYLHDNPEQDLLLEGHCDWRGTTEYNLGLGDRRASSVREYLITLGISGNRIEVLSMGDLEATVDGTEDQMARDRRVDFVILQ